MKKKSKNPCKNCKGSGRIFNVPIDPSVRADGGWFTKDIPCPCCKGKGTV